MRGLLPDEEPATESTYGRSNTRTPVVAWDDVAEPRSTSKHGRCPSKNPQITHAKSKAKPKGSETLSLPTVHGSHSTNQDDAPQNDVESADPGADLRRLNSHVLRARYPRFVESLQLAPTAKISPRVRLITWLLRLIEDIYNNLSECFTSSSSAASPPSPEKRVTAPGSKLVMPFLARRCIHHALGLRELADQECVDLIFNVELRRE